MSLPFDTTSSLLKYILVCAIWSLVQRSIKHWIVIFPPRMEGFNFLLTLGVCSIESQNQSKLHDVRLHFICWVNANDYFVDGLTSVFPVDLICLFQFLLWRLFIFLIPKMPDFTGHKVLCYMAVAAMYLMCIFITPLKMGGCQVEG